LDLTDDDGFPYNPGEARKEFLHGRSSVDDSKRVRIDVGTYE
jgi:hypothetical protein